MIVIRSGTVGLLMSVTWSNNRRQPCKRSKRIWNTVLLNEYFVEYVSTAYDTRAAFGSVDFCLWINPH